ncbi:hypothetical protein L596_023207 [Steinernema carpocapsae]|uniref:SXP/RAL-2 family protein Ani s 5-like cation-binding domain-containing protein n=1 Tax=Steinernema carpocapsae TaxID=34508 RepID=A0A4U5MCZ5_STECR|nr:hypothetical protein L596_023207 [Steinernema carpocapsae]
MQLFVASLAVLAVAVSARPEGGPPPPPGPPQSRPEAPAEDAFAMILKFMPPMIADALRTFSQAGKDAVVKIMQDAEVAAANKQPFGEEKFMEALKAAAPEDFAKLEKASKDLEEKIKASSPAIQDLCKMGETMWVGENPISLRISRNSLKPCKPCRLKTKPPTSLSSPDQGFHGRQRYVPEGFGWKA